MLLNIAGFGTAKFFYHEPLGLQEKMIYAHILAHIQIIYVILPQMIEKGAGMIINVSSAGAFLPSPKTAVCNGTKAFLGALTESLHKELAGSGVQVQVVCPGLTRTDIQIRLGISEEVIVDWGAFQCISLREVVACSIALYYKITNYFFRKNGWIEGA